MSAKVEQDVHDGVALQHPRAFWGGTVLVAGGVAAHIPDFFESVRMQHRMADMPMSPLMLAGMALIITGLALAAYGLIPFAMLRAQNHTQATSDFSVMDQAQLTRQHWALLFVLGIALVVDVMKPATLGFVVPGMKAEYGLSMQEVALFPLTALTGPTIGSLLWGVLADRMGRRATILLASILFMATSICGFMPSFAWNLVMCFIMGVSAGGMLPIVYALMAESMPAKKRGWLVVLHGGIGTVGGYIAAAGLATLLEPHFTWRILWFAGLPTGLLVLVLNRWIPESPRFLLARGRVAEAERVMARYGIVPNAQSSVAVTGVSAPSATPLALLRSPYLVHTVTVCTYGLGWGLVNWGFLTFVPTILENAGVTSAITSRMLFYSALAAVPGTLLAAALYGMWSSKKSMILFAALTVTALVGFAIIDPGTGGRNVEWLIPLMILLFVGSGGVIAMLSPYTAEVYPTALRGSGSGIAAASSKVGGILAPVVAAMVVTRSGGFTQLALAVSAPIIASAVILLITGIETRDRALEEVGRPLTPGLNVSP